MICIRHIWYAKSGQYEPNVIVGKCDRPSTKMYQKINVRSNITKGSTDLTEDVGGVPSPQEVWGVGSQS